MKYSKESKDGKQQGSQTDKSSRVVSTTVMFVVLCGFSFYLGGIFCSEKNRFGNMDAAKHVTKAVQSPKEPVAAPLQVKSVVFPECSSDFQDYTPCTDPKVLFPNTLSTVESRTRICISNSVKVIYSDRGGRNMVPTGLHLWNVIVLLALKERNA